MVVGAAMLHKFALVLKIKTIELFTEEEGDKDANIFVPSPAAGADGVLARQQVAVLKPN